MIHITVIINSLLLHRKVRLIIPNTALAAPANHEKGRKRSNIIYLVSSKRFKISTEH